LAGARPDFGPLAETYDRLRPVDDNWWELFELLVERGDLGGRRVLEVGCGTGRLALALAERGARVWAVDPSEEMLAAARSHAGPQVRFKRAEAEALPFKAGWFERAVLRLVVHLVERPRAFAELSRVLRPGARIVLATFGAGQFEDWLSDLYPAVAEIDRGRFPDEDELHAELETAGFAEVRATRLRQAGRLGRAEALERIRGRYVSTLRLLDEATYEEGLARAERELPEEIEYHLDWLVLDAVRPPG
jgi:ubiquinone/menaquinone biosynthesis C-methylase UbiE